VATETGAAVVVGGRALTAGIRQLMAYSAYCDTLRHLVTFASSLTSIEFARHKQEKPDGPNASLGTHHRRLSEQQKRKRKDD